MLRSDGHPNSSKNANITPFDHPKPVCKDKCQQSFKNTSSQITLTRQFSPDISICTIYTPEGSLTKRS